VPQQTQAQQIAQIMTDLTTLRREHGEAIRAMREQVGKIEVRMKTYEEKQEENTELLKAQSGALKAVQKTVDDVQHTVNGYDANIQSFMEFLKRGFKVASTVVVGVLIIVIAAGILAFWHVPHP
jgi:Sec-independent protein translocase protein TatA